MIQFIYYPQYPLISPGISRFARAPLFCKGGLFTCKKQKIRVTKTAS